MKAKDFKKWLYKQWFLYPVKLLLRKKVERFKRELAELSVLDIAIVRCRREGTTFKALGQSFEARCKARYYRDFIERYELKTKN